MQKRCLLICDNPEDHKLNICFECQLHISDVISQQFTLKVYGLSKFKLLKHKLLLTLFTWFIQSRLEVMLLFLIVMLNPQCCKRGGLKTCSLEREIEVCLDSE